MPVPTYDMAAPAPERRVCSRYVEYLNMYTRRLKRAAGPAPADGAGLLNGARFRGRGTPLKGKGLPPQDGREAPAHEGGLRMVEGRSGAPTDVLITRVPVTPADLAFRPSVRFFRSAFESSMTGAGAVVVQEEPAKRPMRRHGAKAPESGISHTRRRVHADTVAIDGSREWWEEDRPSSVRSWRMPVGGAPADTIIRHRYSDPGTEAKPAKLETARAAAPQVCTPPAEASKATFNSALDGYCANKGRAVFGSTYKGLEEGLLAGAPGAGPL